jgi:hypothetical protein
VTDAHERTAGRSENFTFSRPNRRAVAAGGGKDGSLYHGPLWRAARLSEWAGLPFLKTLLSEGVSWFRVVSLHAQTASLVFFYA